MTTAVLKQALEALEILNLRGGILADYEDVCTDAITALHKAIIQPDCRGCEWRRNGLIGVVCYVKLETGQVCTNGDKFLALPAIMLYKAKP